ncbi:MAG: recombinase family protein [Planctomycetes bacterium]|nr:recombinase family protein [Planctomycetota bacterium]
MITKAKGKRLIPAVGYLRRSSNRQEKSLPDQRREIERHAAQHGYQIVRWYVDDAISGDETDKRRDFQRMHRDATKKARDFDVILCWDQDRFGRFNSMEAGYWIHPLMQAGVGLVTVTDGPIDWSDLAGRMVYSIKQEGKHQFLIDLSRNVARRQIQNAMDGYLCGQAAPHGFDRMIVDEAGRGEVPPGRSQGRRDSATQRRREAA